MEERNKSEIVKDAFVEILKQTGFITSTLGWNIEEITGFLSIIKGLIYTAADGFKEEREEFYGDIDNRLRRG